MTEQRLAAASAVIVFDEALTSEAAQTIRAAYALGSLLYSDDGMRVLAEALHDHYGEGKGDTCWHDHDARAILAALRDGAKA